MTPIQCLGKDNVTRTFWYVAQQDLLEPLERWDFEVHRSSPANRAQDDVFLMTFAYLGSASFMVLTAANNNKAWYRGKGISDALIPEAARVLKKAITSSSNKAACKRYGNESRNSVGEQVWTRFCARGAALYCQASDRFVYIGEPPVVSALG